MWLSSIRYLVRASCALMLACALVSLGHTQDSKSDKVSPKKPAAKTTASKSAAKTTTTHHTTAKKTGSSSSSHASKTKSTAKTHSTSAGKKSSRKKVTHTRGQQKIDSERAESIQTALIREHYLSGEPSRTWDAQSEDAMRRYQADHGWQTKEVPDSRALIKLGLGPSKDGLLNPDSAMTTVPDAPKAASLPTTSHSAPATSDQPSPATAPPSTSPNR